MSCNKKEEAANLLQQKEGQGNKQVATKKKRKWQMRCNSKDSKGKQNELSGKRQQSPLTNETESSG